MIVLLPHQIRDAGGLITGKPDGWLDIVGEEDKEAYRRGGRHQVKHVLPTGLVLYQLLDLRGGKGSTACSYRSRNLARFRPTSTVRRVAR
jgi:hypothetical protein